jgi:hypothetical protein
MGYYVRTRDRLGSGFDNRLWRRRCGRRGATITLQASGGRYLNYPGFERLEQRSRRRALIKDFCEHEQQQHPREERGR